MAGQDQGLSSQGHIGRVKRLKDNFVTSATHTPGESSVKLCGAISEKCALKCCADLTRITRWRRRSIPRSAKIDGP